MDNKIVEVAQNKDDILAELAGRSITCPICSEEWFSVFDKLFISSYGICLTCCPEEEMEAMSENVFAIL